MSVSEKSDTTSCDTLMNDIIKDIFNEVSKPKNKKTIGQIFKIISSFLFDNIKLYLYTIILMLILAFVMNTAQFYYYIQNNNIMCSSCGIQMKNF